MKNIQLLILDWFFCLLFFVIGILNVVLVHLVPGVFYMLLSALYLPATNALLKRRFGFIIPPLLKIVVALIVMWGTLAVGDLAELLGL